MGWLEEQVERDIHYKVKMEQQLQAYKDDNETMAITIRDLNQSHFKILNDLKVHKDKEDKLREYCKELNLASVSEDIEQILNEGSDE